MEARSPVSSHLVTTERLRREEGSIMILALAFLIVILALAVGLLGLAFTGSNSLRAYRLERVRRYNTDSALVAAVQMVRNTPTLGVSTSPPACGMQYIVQEEVPATGPNVTRVFTVNSRLTVTCGASTGVSNSGDPDPDGTGQLARDVTFTVTCQYAPPIPVKGTLRCGTGSANMTLGQARVRFDVDNGVANVPKIISWSLKD